MTHEHILQQIAMEYKKILKENLIGIYIHGSIAFGCFNPEKSDIDFLVVSEDNPVLEQKVQLIQVLLDLIPFCPKKGFEMSLVLKKNCKNFVYPTHYELHFGNDLLTNIKKDIVAYCEASNGLDPDLAAHFMVVNYVGVVCTGEPIENVFAPVPRKNYLDSVSLDIENAKEHIHKDPVYVILNLCRVLAYVQGEMVMSKKQGGEWGVKNISCFKQLVEKSLVCYTSGTVFEHSSEELDYFATFVLKQLKMN